MPIFTVAYIYRRLSGMTGNDVSFEVVVDFVQQCLT
jgi:hypothetical protein